MDENSIVLKSLKETLIFVLMLSVFLGFLGVIFFVVTGGIQTDFLRLLIILVVLIIILPLSIGYYRRKKIFYLTEKGLINKAVHISSLSYFVITIVITFVCTAFVYYSTSGCPASNDFDSLVCPIMFVIIWGFCIVSLIVHFVIKNKPNL